MTAALEGVSVQQQAPAALYTRERPVAHCTGGWVGPRAGLDGRKFSPPTGIRSRTFQPVVSRYTDWATWPTTEMSTRNISWKWRLPVRRADNLTTFMCRLSWNLVASTSWNHLGLSRPVMGLLFYLTNGQNPLSWKSIQRFDYHKQEVEHAF